MARTDLAQYQRTTISSQRPLDPVTARRNDHMDPLLIHGTFSIAAGPYHLEAAQ